MATNHTTPTPYGNNDKPASFAVAVLAIALILALAANKCSAKQGTANRADTHVRAYLQYKPATCNH